MCFHRIQRPLAAGVLFWALGSATLLRAQVQAVSARPLTPSDFARSVWQDQKDIYTSPFRLKKADLNWLLPLAGVSGFLIAGDAHNMRLIHSDQAVQARSSSLSNVGLATFGVGALTSYGIGAFTHDEHEKETGWLTAEAMANSFLVVNAVALITQRQRPGADSAGKFWTDPSLSSSFPSDHAALAWSAAAIIAREYPGPVSQWSAYGLASLVSLSRITAEKHFPSDVLVGSIAGYLIGRHIYNARHDDSTTDSTGSTPTRRAAFDLTTTPQPVAKPPDGSVFVPLDSWIYPALRRIAELGYIPDQVSNLAPWTRAECARQVQEAFEMATGRQNRDAASAIDVYVLALLDDLQSEFGSEPLGQNAVRLESIYTRTTNLNGPPLRDSYHFGQTLVNDFGRAYGRGINDETGVSGYAISGRFSVYLRGEYQEAPGAPAYSLPVREFIASADQNPLQPATPAPKISRFEPLEMYTGVQLGLENITFGKQSLWWAPGQQSAFSFSDNAAPFYMLRLAQTRPLTLPGPFALLGKIRTEIILGKLSGHQWPARPFVNAQKISLDLTSSLELGFTRSAFFGGVGHPLTFGSLTSSVLSVNSVDYGPYGSPDTPGDRHSDFDFRWRLPGLGHYVTLYSDSYADDEPNPIDSPRRSAWSPGLYFSHLPKLKRLDLAVETVSTLLYRKDYGGDFLYWDNQYHDSYTNDGNLLGSWIGRDSRAYIATANFWLSAKSRLQGQYRQTKAGTRFLPGGGTQTDAFFSAQLAISQDWLVAAEVQVERYFIPLLGSPQLDVMSSLQLTFTPKTWIRQK